MDLLIYFGSIVLAIGAGVALIWWFERRLRRRGRKDRKRRRRRRA